MRARRTAGAAIITLLAAVAGVSAAGTAPLPDPDGKPAPMDKKVQVFILSGQSNMCGMGKKDSLKSLAGEETFGYLFDEDGNYTVRKDAYYIYYVMGTRLTAKGWVSATVNGRRVGPEGAIGHILGHYLEEPVLLIKVACGNRSLGYDIMPPTAREKRGITEKGGKWYCGISYDRWVACAKNIIANLDKHYPGYRGQGFEVAGFFWWQGHKDKGMPKQKYEELLVDLIKDFRKDFEAPDAPFVVATIAFNGNRLGAWKGVWEAQMAVGDPKQHPAFKGTVGSVDIRDLGGGGYHYGNNGARYTRIGDRMGHAMVKLLEIAEKKKQAAGGTAGVTGKPAAPPAAPDTPKKPLTDAEVIEQFKLAETYVQAGNKDRARAILITIWKQRRKDKFGKMAMERLSNLHK